VRRSERRRIFNVPEFKRLAAAAISRRSEDVFDLRKLAEGGFNRTFLITMHDGFQLVGRIPYLGTEPKHLCVASEAATLQFLKSNGLPVPKVYAYSNTAKNAAGTEYIFMELINGTNLGDVWLDLFGEARVRIVTKLVDLEAKLFALSLPACGSIYFTKDLPADSSKVAIPTTNSALHDRFCIGPNTILHLWHGKRMNIQADRGPCTYLHFFHLR
jgi:hypothetical protein